MSNELDVKLGTTNTHLVSNDNELKKATLTCNTSNLLDPNDEKYSKTYKDSIMEVKFNDDGKPYLWYGREGITKVTESKLGEYTTSIVEDNERVLVSKSTDSIGNTPTMAHYNDSLVSGKLATVSFDYKVKHLATLLNSELNNEKAKYFENTAPLYIIATWKRNVGWSVQGFALNKNEDGTYFISLIGHICCKGSVNSKKFRVRSNDLNIDFTQWQHIEFKGIELQQSSKYGVSLYINGKIISFYLDNPDGYTSGTIESETSYYLLSPTVLRSDYHYACCFNLFNQSYNIYYAHNFNSAVPMYIGREESLVYVDRGEETWYKNFKATYDRNKTTVIPYPSITYTWLKGNELSTDILKTNTYNELKESDTLEVTTDNMDDKQQQFTCVVKQEDLSGNDSIMLWQTKKLNPTNKNKNKKIIKVSGVLKDNDNNPLPLHYIVVHTNNKSWVSLLTNNKGEYEFYLRECELRLSVQDLKTSEILLKGFGVVNENSVDCELEDLIQENWNVV